ncbi:DUF11 domain-containing protein [Microcoleus sp. FACHB-831]|uniref:DUF11 domain-containing protein n=1 Tax=Microcoleus sp. FACHB-831 TaxID=2692827 RepID=UPI0016886D48|nr:DUF11 domain-containing protein [Microcoleus sp. FACHB-831]MBD1922680.1 DUF11 domain-containing protein [Microcoleus sp. FACHB-831]
MFKVCRKFPIAIAAATRRRKNSIYRLSKQIGCLALLISTVVGYKNEAALAEGSRELTSSGGNRPYLNYRNDLSSGILRRTVIRVYVQPGETIDLGSSAVGLGQGVITYRDPNGTSGSCLTTGKINTRAQEVAGPLPNIGGYTPCSVKVGPSQGGIWEINFVSPNPDNATNPPPALANAELIQPDNVGFVTAWDVTVKNSSGTPIPGRAYANYFALNLGSNGLALSSLVYILTRDGYLYQIDFNRLDPFGFIFFANNKGFKDTSGNPIYRSIQLVGDNPGVFPPGITVQDPGALDTPTDVTHKLFFNLPSGDLPLVDVPIAGRGTTWLRKPPTPPPTVSNFTFAGLEGTLNQTGTAPPLGGNFTFQASGTGGYRIDIDINQDGVFGNANDRVFFGPTVGAGAVNTVFWDGLDANGNPVPPGTVAYGAKITLTGTGEVHFPFLDPENDNPNGLVIQQFTSTGQPLPSIVYYNDTGLTGGTPPNPVNALFGLDGKSGVHAFTNGFGDRKGIDTWSYVPSPESSIVGGIVVARADLQIQKTHAPEPVVAGGIITYTITVTNNGPSNAVGATVQDTVPPQITGVTWTCAITGTGSCGQTSGQGNAINTTVNLNAGSVATFTVRGTISPSLSSGSLPNTATVSRSKDANDDNPNNNTATDNTTVQPNPVSPIGIKSVRLATDADGSGTVTTGDTVEFSINYVNNTSTPVIEFRATDNIDPTKLSFVAGSYSLTAAGSGTVVTPNPNYNGTTDPNFNNDPQGGTLGAGGGNVVIKYRAIVTAQAGISISNQAVATSRGGTSNLASTVVTDAFQSTEDLPQVTDDNIEQGNAPTITGDDEPTVVTVAVPGNPSLRLVKRITSITRGGVALSGINFGGFVDDPTDENDTAGGFSQLLPAGIVTLGSETPLQSGDEVEYTVYFLSDGTAIANDVRFCDLIPASTTFVNQSFGANSGISLNRASAASLLTNAADTDGATFFSPLTPLPNGNACSTQNNANGAVFVNLGNVSNMAGSNYGFIRFRVKVN